jgi:hypothetical protein
VEITSNDMVKLAKINNNINKVAVKLTLEHANKITNKLKEFAKDNMDLGNTIIKFENTDTKEGNAYGFIQYKGKKYPFQVERGLSGNYELESAELNIELREQLINKNMYDYLISSTIAASDKYINPISALIEMSKGEMVKQVSTIVKEKQAEPDKGTEEQKLLDDLDKILKTSPDPKFNKPEVIEEADIKIVDNIKGLIQEKSNTEDPNELEIIKQLDDILNKQKPITEPKNLPEELVKTQPVLEDTKENKELLTDLDKVLGPKPIETTPEKPLAPVEKVSPEKEEVPNVPENKKPLERKQIEKKIVQAFDKLPEDLFKNVKELGQNYKELMMNEEELNKFLSENSLDIKDFEEFKSDMLQNKYIYSYSPGKGLFIAK